MLQLSLAGRCGRDAEYKQTQGGTDMCRFTVAADVGYGENKQTIWVDVTKWGKGAQGLAGYIRKGDPIAVTGEMSLREHEGKSYVQCRADNVTLLASKGDGRGERKRGADNGGWVGQAPGGDLDDDLPAF